MENVKKKLKKGDLPKEVQQHIVNHFQVYQPDIGIYISLPLDYTGKNTLKGKDYVFQRAHIDAEW